MSNLKVAVIAANGKSGQAIVKEAVERGLDVTALVRGENKSVAPKFLKRDLFDLTKEDLTQFDVVVNASGFWTPETLDNHTKGAEHLSILLDGENTRLLVVGGTGSLYTDESLSQKLYEKPTFSKDFFELAKAMSDALEIYRKSNTNWTVISPGANFYLSDEKTNNYEFAGEVFTLNEKGESKISYSNYASAMLDELLSAKNVKKRISVFEK